MDWIRHKKKIAYFALGIIGLLSLVIFQNFQQDRSSVLGDELKISDREIMATRLQMAEDLERESLQNLDFDTSTRIRRIAVATSVQDNEPVRIKLKRKPPSVRRKNPQSRVGVKKKSSTPVKNKLKKKSNRSKDL